MVSPSESSHPEGSSGSEEKFFLNLKWMNTQEAARFLRVSEGQIRNLVHSGELKAYRLKCRLRFLRSDLDRLIS